MNINLTNQEVLALQMCIFEKANKEIEQGNHNMLSEDTPLMTALDKILKTNTGQEK